VLAGVDALATIEVSTDPWPAIEFGAQIRMAVAGSHVKALLEHADGVRTAIDWRRWCSRPDTADRSVLTRVAGTTLDVGCGPGRLTVALAARGHAVLGIDVTPDAVSLTRAAGGVALHRSVFTHIPGEGRWDTVLLIDGNVGIGGDPIALLHRVSQLLAPSGRVLIELEPPKTVGHVGPARIRRADGVVTSWFPWARVPVGTIGGIAGAAGFRTRESWCVDGRWFTALEPVARR
jgi:SAM-dependent methyltransferase